jgi:aminotransferase
VLENIKSERVKKLPPSIIAEFYDRLERLPSKEGLISLGVGEPGFATPWHICEAVIGGLKKGYTKYTGSLGMLELRQELSRYLKNRYGLEYDPDSEFIITVGVGEAVDLVFRAILNPSEEIIMPDPHYAPYEPLVILAGGVPVPVPTTEENNFEISAADIEARITKKTKAILLEYPNNPTGAVMPKDKLLQIAELAKRYNLPVISDEIYSMLVYGVEHTCVATLPGMKERTILLNGFSKAYAMTGWRIGYIAASHEVIRAVLDIHQYTILCASMVSSLAAIEALKTGEADIKEMVEEYNKRRLVMVKGLNDIGLSCFEPRGAFYAFPSIKSTGMKSFEFAEKLLNEEKVAVIPGTAFGKAGEGYVRCTYAAPLPDIEEALVRMKRFVKRHK